jgi:hypothetical protein
MRVRLEGGCYCGGVRFEVDELFDAGYCHCSICQRFSGAPAVAWANTPARSFRVTRGMPRGYASSDHWMRYFCPACGAPVYGRHPQPPADGSDLACFLIPSLDEPTAVRPTAHIWCSSRLPFFEIRDDLPRFDDGRLSHPRERQPCVPERDTGS